MSKHLTLNAGMLSGKCRCICWVPETCSRSHIPHLQVRVPKNIFSQVVSQWLWALGSGSLQSKMKQFTSGHLGATCFLVCCKSTPKYVWVINLDSCAAADKDIIPWKQTHTPSFVACSQYSAGELSEFNLHFVRLNWKWEIKLLIPVIRSVVGLMKFTYLKNLQFSQWMCQVGDDDTTTMT